MKFKEEYESLNGQISTTDKAYRTIEIDKDNPFVYTDCENLVKLINDGESFVVYFGANWCPWCRSVLPEFIKVCHQLGVKKVYYVNVRPDNDKEKEIRDVYSKDESGKIYLSHTGTQGYHEFCRLTRDVLDDYDSAGITLEGTEFEGEKRIDAPSFILVINGKAVELTQGISDKQYDPYMTLNDAIIADMNRQFAELLGKLTEAGK